MNMVTTYLGARSHIAQILEKCGIVDPPVVVDAVTLNREELVEQLETTANAAKRLLIRPEVINADISDRAADYLAWIDTIESRLRQFGETRVLSLPRSVEDWEEDINNATEFKVFCLVEPAQFISLISRKQRTEIVQAAVNATAAGAKFQSTVTPSTVPADSITKILSSEVDENIRSEKVKPADLYNVMVTAGMGSELSNRVVSAQQLAVSEVAIDNPNEEEALEDFRIYVSRKK